MFRATLSAKLIDSCFHGFQYPFGSREILHAPGAGWPDRIPDMRVSNQAPVGTDDAIILIFLTQQTGDDSLVERHRYIFIGLVDRNAVIGHDGGSLCFESSLKRNQMIVKIIAGIDLAFLEFKMRIQSLSLWTTAREMFGHTGNTVRTQRLALKAFDICFP